MARRGGYELPDDYAAFVARYFGEEGASWLARLPDILDWCAATWDLAIGPPEFTLSFNYVVPATLAGGTRAVLKVGYPEPEFLGEIDALLFFNGEGIVRLIEHDYDHGAQLLERLEPGAMLLDLFPDRDEEATTIAAGVMQQLWKPPPEEHCFPSVAGWARRGMQGLRERFGGGTGPFPARLVEQAESLFDELLGLESDWVVLHGDLHHYNILTARRAPWLAIDPKGVIGPPAYETAPFIWNPLYLSESHDIRVLFRRRIAQLAEQLGIERDRIWGLAMAGSVLSAWWNYDDSDDTWRHGIELSDSLAAVEP